MSYKRESKRVLSGSLNLLQPGDKIPDSDGTQIENWRVDQSGALVSRSGMAFLWTYVDQANLYVQSMSRRGGTFYYGAGTYLYRSGPTAIQTGFDGNPIGAIAYNGYSWFMNQNLRCKDGLNPTTGLPQVTNWGIAAPTNVILPSGETIDPVGLVGTYQWYFTFVSADGTESNPSKASAAYALLGSGDVIMTVPNFSPDAQIVGRNVYRSGGTLGQAYRVSAGITINDNTTYVFTDTMNDLNVTLLGIPMPINHDLPPACAGVCGPYLGTFFAWNGVVAGQSYVNRMWYSLPNLPQYFPGAALTTGQWFDVGDDGEAIVAVVPHARMLVIYKQRSIWRLIGDPYTGYLERSDSTTGALAVNGVCNAGQIDYFIGTEGIYSFDGDHAAKVSPLLDPLFRGASATPVYISDSLTTMPMNYGLAAQASIGYAAGRLYFSFAEQGQTYNSMTLIYHEASQRWYTMRYFPSGSFDGGLSLGFGCFLYANPTMQVGGLGRVMQLETGTADSGVFIGGTPIDLAYQSRYEDCGSPDNQKMYLDVTIEAACGSAVTVMVVYNNGAGGNVTLGTIPVGARGKATFPLGTDGVLAFNMAVRLQSFSTAPVTIYSVYFSYYVEARLTETVSTIPVDLGNGKVKQVKEVQADLDCSTGPAVVTVQSDLPGNQIVTRQTLTAAQSTGRRIYQMPTSQTWEGRLWRFSIDAPTNFRLYSLRILMRVMAVYVEAYEAAAGFLWDSMEQDFSRLKRYPPDQYDDPIKRARNLQFDIEADGAITVNLYSDLPNPINLASPQFTATIQTTGNRRIVTLQLPQGLTPMIEGKLFRLQIAGAQQYKLFDARLEVIEMGVYIEAYESAGGATYDSREMDFGSAKVKEARELQLDVETTGNITAQLLSDMPGFTMQVVASTTFNTQSTTTGRRKIHLVLPQLEGRLWRLLITGPSAFRLYGARLEVRAFGEYYTSDEAGQGGFWDSTELDLGARNAKEIRDIEFELWAYAPVTVTLYLDLPGNTMTAQLSAVLPATNGRRKWSVPLPQNSPYLYGRLLRVTVSGYGAFKLFGARVNWRPVGTYVEAYEGVAGAIWDSTVVTLADGKDVVLDQVRFEIDAPNAVTCSIYTDLPGETLTLRKTLMLTTGTSGRSWATIEMPGGISGDTQGRIARVTLSSTSDFRVYQGQFFARRIGRYLAANVSDTFRTLDWDGGMERVKGFKKIEVDAQTDGPVTLTFFTNQSTQTGGGTMAAQYTTVINTGGLRETLEFILPYNMRGRLMRIEIGGAASGRLYGLRVWLRPLNEPGAKWEWAAFTLEESEAIAQWKPLPVEPTPDAFQWSDLPVPPTAPQWSWQDFTVKPTDPQWTWGEFNVESTSETWEWVDIPMDQIQ